MCIYPYIYTFMYTNNANRYTYAKTTQSQYAQKGRKNHYHISASVP